ncbi:MAG: DUF1566 domain-containing protein [Selenomonadaceae bacterium]|nr:DUF1566 domain-containing protein [Selenomonadaceae bacterium]
MDYIFDAKNNLFWEVKSFDAADARYFKRKMTWEDFQDYIKNLNEKNYGGFNDWRAPSRAEMRTLIKYGKVNPAFDAEIFQSLLPDNYWCGFTSYALREDCGWVINLNLGASTTQNKTLKSYGVAVRGEKQHDGTARFIDNGDGTITDTVAKLMWQKEQPAPKSYNDVQEMLKTFELAGYKDWRLPTMYEIGLIFDETYENGNWYYDKFFECDKVKPPMLQHITANIFENTYVWIMNFNFGYEGYYGEKFVPLPYRLVRNLETVAQDKFQMPSGGQKEIFDYKGNVIGVNENFGATDFVVYDNFIFDKKTGLSYAKNSAETFTFEEAQEHVKKLNAANFGGKNDWRLPNVDELRFIADYSEQNPAVFDEFKNFVAPIFYWTGEEHAITKNTRAWGIYFGYGCTVPIDKNQKCGVIAVSGGYVNLRDHSENRYKIENGVVIDTFTNLMWLQQEFPLMSVAEIEKLFAENEFAGQKGWRIPDLKELSTIFNRSAEGGRWYDEKLFPDIYNGAGMFLLARETFNGMYNWGSNIKFAYDGYYADRFSGKYRVKAVKNL